MLHQDNTIREYLQQREATGRVIIHNLIEPSYNMVALSKELKVVAGDEDRDQPSLNLMITLAERILAQVINLHDISFNNDRLIFLSIFDVQDMVNQLIRTKVMKGSLNLSLGEPADPVQVLGDKELTRFWIDSVFNLIQDIYGSVGNRHIVVENNDDARVTVKIQLYNSILQDFAGDFSFMDKAQHVDYITRLLRANVVMHHDKDFLEVSLHIPKDPASHDLN